MTYRTVRDTNPFRPGLVTCHRKLALLFNLAWLLALGVWAGAASHWWPTPVAAAQGEQGTRLLELGKPIERELAGGQSHAYQITLAEGQYLNVIVEQRGIDVVVRLLGPDGKQIMEFDSEISKQGQETVSQVAEAAGSYRLHVQAKQKEAPAGGYEIQAAELRAATEKDRVLQEARKLSAESLRLYRAGKYDEALPLAERALELREKELGPEHAVFASSLSLLANIYYNKGNFAKAEPMYERGLAIREKALGPEHTAVATSLDNLAILYLEKMSDYVKAEPLIQRALAIREKALGPDHPDVAVSLTNIATIRRENGDYVKAEPLYKRALAIREKALGSEHPDITSSINPLAILYEEKGDYDQAKALYQRALSINEKTLGPEHLNLVPYLNGLARIYNFKGDYANAELLSQQALAVLEKRLGADHPRVAASLYNLARLSSLRGDYAKAEQLFQRGLYILEKSLGREHLNVAFYLGNLAALHVKTKDYAKAEPLLQRSRAILEKLLGPDHAHVGRALNNLASLYSGKGDEAMAEQHYQRSLVIKEKTLGLEHPEVASSLNNLGLIYRDRGDYAKAEPMLQRALDISKKALGPWHPDVADSLNSLATLHSRKGEIARAVKFRSQASEVSERNLALNLAAGSERQKMAYLTTLAVETNHIISLHVRSAPQEPTAGSLATTIILQRKGRVLDAMFDGFSALRRRFNAQDQSLLDQLKDANTQLARLALGGPQRTTPAERQKQIKALEERKESLENQISRRAEFRAQSQPVTFETVQSAIPTDAAVIEFFSYHPFDAKYAKPGQEFGPRHYVAYVLRRQGEPQWVELGEAKAIDEAVAAWRKALRDPKRADVRRLARQVDEQVVRPVRGLLGDTRRVFISPDGMLNLIPFAALVDERDRYLIDRYSFSYLTSGRDLLRLRERLPSKPESVVVADPIFGERAGVDLAQRRDVEIRPDPQTSAAQSGILDRIHFPRLAATAGEAQALKAILPQAVVLTREHATEEALKRLSSPRILHVATHGFFLQDAETKQAYTRDVVLLSDGGGLGGAQLQNPLLRSGLALAGANLRKGGEDDGVLTAMEVAGLDLWGTKLVVLSACDTGVGEVKNGEGVYGLRRALVLAGSETQVMSLWPVSDAGTRDLMIEYYKALQRGEGRAEALRQVQLRMLKRKDRSHPFYWASFIQSGEWANLEGKR